MQSAELIENSTKNLDSLSQASSLQRTTKSRMYSPARIVTSSAYWLPPTTRPPQGGTSRSALTPRGSGRKYLRTAGGGPGRSPSVPAPTAPTPRKTHHPGSRGSAGRSYHQETAALAHHGAAPSSPALPHTAPGTGSRNGFLQPR